MAINSTIYKATLNIANMDTHYYQEHSLTIAQHPSETDERLMVRLLAFALYADEHLSFGKDIGKGLDDEDEPALWIKDLSGHVQLWVEVGLPDERRIRKACGRAKQVCVIIYGRADTAKNWWEQSSKTLGQRDNLNVIYLPAESTKTLAAMATRSMQLSCNIEEKQITLSDGTTLLTIDPAAIYTPA